MNITPIFRRLVKSRSLRIVNLLGLSVIFACLLLSYRYIRKELSYDLFNGDASRMLNRSFIYRILFAFVIASPLAWWVMQQWLANFAHKTSLAWWIFALAGIAVLLFSVVSVSWQSWRASVQNPAEVVKSE